MNKIFLSLFNPLNIYFIVGKICCENQYNTVKNKELFLQYNCFLAHSFYEANLIIIFGNLNIKAKSVLKSHIDFLPNRYQAMHIGGCFDDVDIFNNLISHKSCTLEKANIKPLLTRGRTCLIA